MPMHSLVRPDGHAIRSARMELGLKQIELADRVGTNQPYLSLIENGKTVNRGVIIQRLADALGREPGELIRNDET